MNHTRKATAANVRFPPIADIRSSFLSKRMAEDDATDFELSLEALEARDWGEPSADDTVMVKRIYALRRKPLRSLTDDELRLAVSQEVGVPFILDLAFERLANEPLLDGGCYPGDVLSSLIRADQSIWEKRSSLRETLAELYSRALNSPADVSDAFRESLALPEGDIPH
jgi:hypothetical protein